MGVTDIILNQSFFDYAQQTLTKHARAYIEIRKQLSSADNLLRGDRPDFIETYGIQHKQDHNIFSLFPEENSFLDHFSGANSGVSIMNGKEAGKSLQPHNTDDELIEDTEWEDQYALLRDALDDYCLTSAYFLKIQRYIPALISQFKAYHSANVSKEAQGMSTTYLNLDALQYTDFVIEVLHQEICDVCNTLDKIRTKFSDDVLDYLRSDKNKDPDNFARQFYDDDFTYPHQYHSRIEYLFYKTHGIPLGIMQTDTHVAKFIIRQFCDHITSPYFHNSTVTQKMQKRFPGIIISHDLDAKSVTGAMRYDFMSRSIGAIPTSGLIINRSQPGEHSPPYLILTK